MTTQPAIDNPAITTPAVGKTSGAVNQTEPNHWEGRLFGGLVLAAFLLYGIGSTLVDEPIGVGLVVINSIAVTIVGFIGFRLIRHQHARAAVGYLATRVAEALLLGGGVVVYTIADDSNADTNGYLLAMLTLGLGSLPFWYVVGRGPWLSNRFALWGMAGYLLLATGALIELITGKEVTYFFAAPGGLFEAAVGVYLLRRSFSSTTTARDQRTER